MHKRLTEFRKNFTSFKKVSPRTKNNEDLKTKVLDSAGDLFNDLYYLYKEKYEEEKDALNEKYTKKIWLHKVKTL